MNDAHYGNLPIFPTLYGAINEDRVERMVERIVDAGDAIFMNGGATQAQYDAWMKKLDAYVDELYKLLK